MRKKLSGFGVFNSAHYLSFPILVVLLVVLLAVAATLWKPSYHISSSYYAVRMSSGDIYFGNLHRFPKLYLSDAYTLESNLGDSSWPYRLRKISDFLGTEDKLFLNSEQILWTSPLREDGEIAKFITNRSLSGLYQAPSKFSVLNLPENNFSTTASSTKDQ